MRDYERDCCESESDDWDSHTYNAWRGGRISYDEACEWEDDDDSDEDCDSDEEDD